MAIDPITNGDLSTRAKINAAIEKANLVDRKIERAAAADARIAPGEFREFWTTDIADTSSEPAMVDAGLIASGSNGAVLRSSVARTVGPIALTRIEPGRRYLARYVVQRHIDSPDPANDAVRLAVRWFDQVKAPLPGGATVVADLTSLRASDGRQSRTAVLARSAGETIAFVAPANARYGRPYIETFGAGGAVDIEIIDLIDITDAALFAPDVADLAADVASLQSLDLGVRTEALEAAVSAPSSWTLLTTGALAAADVPASVQIIRLLSGAVDGDGRGATYQRVAGPSDIQSVDGAWWQRRPDLFEVGRSAPVTVPDAAKLSARSYVHPRTLFPERHMRRFLANPRPVVVITGDSLSTDAVISLNNRSDSLESLLIKALREAYPEKEITFVNRGVGGQRWFDFNGIPPVEFQAQTTWYDNAAKAWLDYIRELQPELAIVNFGMNDGGNWNIGNFSRSAFFSALNKIRGWPKAPDVIMMSNVKPTTSADHPTYSSVAAQEGRDAVAGWQRSFAETASAGVSPIGLIDVNRWFNVLRDGRDVGECGMVTHELGVSSALPYVPSVSAREYTYRGEFTAIPANFWNPDGIDASPLRIRLSPRDDNVAFLRDAGGFLRIDAYMDSGVLQFQQVSTVATPAAGANVDLRVVVAGSRLRVVVNDGVVYDGPVLRYGGVFVPHVGYNGGAAGPTGNHSLLIGVEQAFVPGLTDAEIYNSESGNSINHPVGQASARIFAPAIRAQNWRGEPPPPVAGTIARRLLCDPECAALDFGARDYIIRSLADPARNAQGNPLDLITVAAGAKAYAVDGTTGETLGLQIVAASQLYIPLTSLPAVGAGGTLIVEGWKPTAGVSCVFAALGPDASNGPRIQVVGNTNDSVGVQVVDNASATVASMSVAQPSVLQFFRLAFSWAANDFDLMANGLLPARDTAGAIPTGLTRLKLGFAGASAPADCVVRKLIFVPRKMNQTRMMALTI